MATCNSVKKKILTRKTLQDVEQFGRLLGKIAESGDVILLYGDLGAGKTTLTQSIAIGLGVPDDMYVTSPSFALLHEYPGRILLYHMDCYRLSGAEDIENAGLAEYIGANGLTVIEWPDRLEDLLPSERLEIHFIRIGENERDLEVCAFGKAAEQRLALVDTA